MESLATWVAPRLQVSRCHRDVNCSVPRVSLVVACSKTSRHGGARKTERRSKGSNVPVAVKERKRRQQVIEDVEEEEEADEEDEDISSYLPSPPAGFIVDDEGEVVLVAPADKRAVKLTDSKTGRTLDCLIRRAFLSSNGLHCLLLMPLDTPLQILKFDAQNERLDPISDEELEQIVPSAEYALAKRRLHFVLSGYCLTARGRFCYTESDILDADHSNGPVAEGVEITTFRVAEQEFVIYTPLEPQLFVACRDEETGELTLASDDAMDDPEVVFAMEEEKDFQQFVDQEL